MIGLFTAYIKTIVVFLIFSAFTEMVMPDNKFKKYISIIIGFLMIIIILNPILGMLKENKMDFSQILENKQSVLISSDFNQDDYEAQQNQMVITIFKDEMNKKISESLKLENAEIINVETIVNEDSQSEGYGQITGINITAKKGSENFVQMKPVQAFDAEVSKMEEEGKEENNILQNEISEKVTSLLEISSEKVHVEVQR